MRPSSSLGHATRSAQGEGMNEKGPLSRAFPFHLHFGRACEIIRCANTRMEKSYRFSPSVASRFFSWASVRNGRTRTGRSRGQYRNQEERCNSVGHLLGWWRVSPFQGGNGSNPFHAEIPERGVKSMSSYLLFIHGGRGALCVKFMNNG